jgi:hypothetical protein
VKIIRLFLFILLLSPATARAQDYIYTEVDRSQHTLLGSSLGFGVVAGEAVFATDLSADYFVNHNMSLGAQVILGGGDFFVFGPQAVAKYTFDLNGVDEWMTRVKPHAEMLMGLIMASGNGSTDVAFLGGFGMGGDYFLNSRFALGTNMLFEFSNDLGGDNFHFFWKVVTVKYLF